MLTEEAKSAAVKAKKKGLDFDAVFKLFDENQEGYIDLNEFKHMLGRLQLITQLPENQIPALLARFDKDKKGKITKDDLIKFVGADKKSEDDLATFADDGEFDADDDYVGQSSNKPPEAITKNADGDWLIWFLWREACKVEPTDPESVITELEAACAETLLTQDDSLLSLDELWAIICDLKLRGTLSKEQFGKHAGEIVKKDAPKGKGGGALYDFEALCRYTVRMGRAYNKIVQAKRIADNELYAKIKMTLQKNLSGMISTDSSESKGAGKPSAEAPRYEKVFRRLDSDGDGLLTMQEFKVALKKFQYEDEKKWTMRMIRRLFNEFDSNQDGLLSVREFSSFIQDFKMTGGTKGGGGGIDQRAFKDREDEEEDKVFGARTSGSADSEILRKVHRYRLLLLSQATYTYTLSLHYHPIRPIKPPTNPRYQPPHNIPPPLFLLNLLSGERGAAGRDPRVHHRPLGPHRRPRSGRATGGTDIHTHTHTTNTSNTHTTNTNTPYQHIILTHSSTPTTRRCGGTSRSTTPTPLARSRRSGFGPSVDGAGCRTASTSPSCVAWWRSCGGAGRARTRRRVWWTTRSSCICSRGPRRAYRTAGPRPSCSDCKRRRPAAPLSAGPSSPCARWWTTGSQGASAGRTCCTPPR